MDVVDAVLGGFRAVAPPLAVHGFAAIAVVVPVVFAIVVVVARSLTHLASVDKMHGVVEGSAKLFEVFLVDEDAVTVKIEDTAIVVKDFTAFTDGDELVAALCCFDVEEILALASAHLL